MKTAKIAVMTGANRPFEVREYPLTPPKPGFASLSLIAGGVCGTDIHIHRGKIPVQTPATPGHEFIGRVEKIAPEDGEKYGISPGDFAAVFIAVPCGECPLCLAGDDANCVRMGLTNGGDVEAAPHFYGGFGEYCYAPVKNLIKIPVGVPPETAAVFACPGPTVIHAFALAKRAACGLEKAKTAVVQGLGPVGLFSVIWLAALGVENIVAVTGRPDEKRAGVAKAFGASHVMSIGADGPDAVCEKISALGGGLGAELVIEASGNPEAFAQGLSMLRNRGVYLVPGQYSNSGGAKIAPELITFKALQIFGSSQYSEGDIREYFRFLAENPGLYPGIDGLAARYPLAEINSAFADSAAGKNIKTLIV